MLLTHSMTRTTTTAAGVSTRRTGRKMATTRAGFDDDARVSRAHLMIVRFATSPDERERRYRRRERGERAHASESRR